jgi:hypothetical protein
MTESVKRLDASPTLLTRVLDSIDRGQARAADRLHTLRGTVRSYLEGGLDRFEGTIRALRDRLDHADKSAANGIIRAQGAANGALEKLRHARSNPDQVTS